MVGQDGSSLQGGGSLDPRDPIRFDHPASRVPPERWPELVRERRRWVWSEGFRLFQQLETFAAEAPELAEALGYADAGSLLRQGYGLDLVIGPRSGRWLRLLRQSPASGPVERTCACCGTAFTARRRDARYCSSSCRSRVSRSRRRGR